MPSALLGTGYPWMLMWLTDDLLTRRPVPVEAGLKRGLKVLQEHPSPVTDLWLGAADDVIMRARGVEFVDATGRVFAVEHVHKTGYRGLWGWNPLRKGRQVRVRFALQENGPVALEAFKQTLLAQLLTSPRVADRAGVLRAVHAATNFRGLIRLFR